MLKKFLFVSSIALSLPVLASATTTMTLMSFIDTFVIPGLSKALVVIMAVAVVMFVYYVVKYFITTGAKSRAEAGLYILYSLLGFFIILSFWGLVYIVQNTFNLGNSGNTPQNWSSLSNIFPSNGGSGSGGASGQSNQNQYTSPNGGTNTP